MPNFGNPATIGEGEYIYTFTWNDWASWPKRRIEGSTPARVLWEPKAGCVEKYRMVPGEWENPPI